MVPSHSESQVLGSVAGDDRRFAMLEEMKRHQREVATLSRTLERVGKPLGEGAAGPEDPRSVLLTADRTKHLISIALLSAQLRRRSS